MAIFDPDGSAWKARLTRWTPEMHARHQKDAARLFRAGWNADTSALLAYLQITEPVEIPPEARP